MPWTFEILLIVFAVFFVGGIVKGVIGTGLPTVAVALLAAAFDVRTAILLLMGPAIATNVWQAFAGRSLVKLVRRLAPFLSAIFIGVIGGYLLFSAADDRILLAVLGSILCVYAAVSLMKVDIPSPGRRENSASAAVGLVNGTITGITGTFVVPSVIYLRVLDFERRELIQAMGITFLFSITVLSLVLGVDGKISAEIGTLSLVAIAPAIVGQIVGQAIRDRLAEPTFRAVFLMGLGAIGIYLLTRAIAGF
ncbi:MAG: sulfite exporter TauE/SafE family protein [Pseudomonadota bacterium]